jgi:RNA polymerase sigma-70 factor (ECF subfamily)
LSENWEQIAAEHGQMVIRTAMRVLGRWADAEDVAQEVFLEAFSSSGRKVRNWGAFLRRLAVFRAIDRRRQRRDEAALSPEMPAVAGFSPHDEAVSRELAGRLRSMIADLPQCEGAVFALRYFEQLTNPQIAEILGISVGAVAAAVHKVRVKLESTLSTATLGDAG